MSRINEVVRSGRDRDKDKDKGKEKEGIEIGVRSPCYTVILVTTI